MTSGASSTIAALEGNTTSAISAMPRRYAVARRFSSVCTRAIIGNNTESRIVPKPLAGADMRLYARP